ncbi:pilus assembly protein [Mesorhizobium sp. WSM4935]|uniref:TadE/TadG family type IV pilus assembly protein n=1 Tax=Mesorhizobium sp. WSM4935 TaxID=3038547 RepID=UPI0024151346|nr:TadE/TadG family type IV pilus assembly protein [Mesorhizobium sp. WSM4935]MDG4874236.1 pilus assembly protein [Mesorhizobium sp. WSM4935]
MLRLALRHLAKFRRDQRGAVMVEMTLVAPLMLALSAGVFEFGNLIHDKLLMEAGLSDGARFGARCNSQIYTDAGLAAINCANLATNIAVFGNVAGSGTARVPGWLTTNVTVTIGTGCHDAVVNGVTQYRSTTAQVCVVQASGTYPYTGIGMLALIGIGPITLSGSHQERLMRF